MRIMGLDYGEKTIGVAVSDPLGWTAQGLQTITYSKNMEVALTKLFTLIQSYEVEEIVLGFPKNMNGSLGPQAQKALGFAEILKKRFGLSVHLWDERMTTKVAEQTLLSADVSRSKRKRVIDQLAAVIILQGFLDYRNKQQ
jgi:putative Holliday junction resolvase